jgi:hypothetical protein
MRETCSGLKIWQFCTSSSVYKCFIINLFDLIIILRKEVQKMPPPSAPDPPPPPPHRPPPPPPLRRAPPVEAPRPPPRSLLRAAPLPAPSPTRRGSSPNRPRRRRAMDAQPASTTKPSRIPQIRHPATRIRHQASRIWPGAGCIDPLTLRSCVGELLLPARPLIRPVPRSTTAAAFPPLMRRGNAALTPGE